MASSSPETRKSGGVLAGLFAVLSCLALQAGVSANASSQRAEPTRDGVLVLVERQDTDTGPGFSITFDRPLQLVSGPAKVSADQFQLQLRPVRTVTNPLLKNAVTWEPDTEMPLQYVELDVTPAQDIVLTLTFSRSVSLGVKPSPRLESVNFSVADVYGASVTVPGSPPEPGAGFGTVRRVDATANRERVTEAQRAIAAGDYDRALDLLDRLGESGTPDQVRFAMEFRGVALERSGRTTLAAAEYRRFLETYPQAPETGRVQQRLAALDGAAGLPRAAVRASRVERTRRNDQGWSSFGSMTNSYRYTRNVDDSGNAYDAISMIGMDADLSTRHRSARGEWQLRMSGGHYEDMRSDGEGSSDRIRYLSLAADTRDRGLGFLLGRQRSYGGGVLSRFDGITMYGRPSEHTQVNLVAGYPVNTTEQTFVETSRNLYGVNVDFEDILRAADINTFFIRQNNDGLLDREAVGAELNLAAGKSTMYGLVDYDVHFGELNAATLSGNHLLASGSRVNWALNLRKSPYLSTTNALYGQGVLGLDQLKELLTDDEIEELANDRTRDSRSASLTVSQPLSDRFDLSSSVTWLELSGTTASGGVPAYDSTGSQYYVDIRLSGQRLFSLRDLSFVGLRYNTLETTDIWSFYANSRVGWGERLSLNPRVRVDHRNNANGTSQWNLSPGLRLQYQTPRSLFYTEAGMIYYRTEYPQLDSQEFKTYFAFVGYRLSY